MLQQGSAGAARGIVFSFIKKNRYATLQNPEVAGGKQREKEVAVAKKLFRGTASLCIKNNYPFSFVGP